MHPNYQKFSVEEFTRDDYFRQWVIHRDPQSEAFWLAWVRMHPELTGKVQLARSFLYALEEKNAALSASELATLATGIIQQDKQRIRLSWPRKLVAMAASILLVVGLSYLFFLSHPRHTSPDTLADISPVLAANYTESQNNKPDPQQVSLQDGTIVTLYQNSRLRYPTQFSAHLREVYLTGKAFFSVTKNPKKPFWVHTDRISTQVLGTSFLVTAEAKQATVQVRTGRVSVYTRNDIRQARQLKKNELVGVVLTANQQVALLDQEDRLVKSIVQQPLVLQRPEAYEYLFDEAPLGQVFRQLEKTYGLSVMYDPQTVKNCFITANLSGESLFDKLNLVCRIAHATYEIVDGQIIIHSLGCDGR